jgi:hypothetical protein
LLDAAAFSSSTSRSAAAGELSLFNSSDASPGASRSPAINSPDAVADDGGSDGLHV